MKYHECCEASISFNDSEVVTLRSNYQALRREEAVVEHGVGQLLQGAAVVHVCKEFSLGSADIFWDPRILRIEAQSLVGEISGLHVPDILRSTGSGAERGQPFLLWASRWANSGIRSPALGFVLARAR
jgi:hypothetical protein